MKKFLKMYLKVSVKLYVIYALVAWIGDWIIARHPLKREDYQSYAKLVFAMMKYCCLSPYYTIKGIFGKKEEVTIDKVKMFF